MGSSRVSSRCSQSSRAGRAPDPAREHRHRREDAAALDQPEAAGARQIEILGDRPIARMLGEIRRVNQPAAQGEVHARLQVREIGHGDEELTARRDHAKELRQRLRLLGKRQMFEHVETQGAIERRCRIGQRVERSASHPLGTVVGIDALNREPVVELVDEHAFAASGVEDARPLAAARRGSGGRARVWRDTWDRTPTQSRVGDGSRRARRIHPSERRMTSGSWPGLYVS